MNGTPAFNERAAALRRRLDRMRTYGWRHAWLTYGEGYLYFRIFGYGLHFKNWKTAGCTFSERNFFDVKKRVLIVGFIIIKVLKP